MYGIVRTVERKRELLEVGGFANLQGVVGRSVFMWVEMVFFFFFFFLFFLVGSLRIRNGNI